MEKKIRIGTRDSRLALWQASKVSAMLQQQGFACELVPLKSEGDLDLVTPLYAMGVQGVFTKTLDAFLLSHKIDIAVHSLKDVPTQPAKGLVIAAVLPRGSYKDLLVYKEENDLFTCFSLDTDEPIMVAGTIATGSVRRKAALLNRFPLIKIENLRGNVQTRLQKLKDNDWDGAIFAAAGLERLDERPVNSREIPWMLPAPGQGAIAVACRETDERVRDICLSLNHRPTEICVSIERDFLKALLGGCSTPISALAEIHDSELVFKGNIISPGGAKKMEIEKKVPLAQARDTGYACARQLLDDGADSIIQEIRSIKP